MDGVQIGRIVHHVGPDGVHRAAIIVEVHPDSPAGMVNLRVFLDAPASEDAWETSVPFDGNPTPGVRTWHWPERA